MLDQFIMDRFRVEDTFRMAGELAVLLNQHVFLAIAHYDNEEISATGKGIGPHPIYTSPGSLQEAVSMAGLSCRKSAGLWARWPNNGVVVVSEAPLTVCVVGATTASHGMIIGMASLFKGRRDNLLSIEMEKEGLLKLMTTSPIALASYLRSIPDIQTLEMSENDEYPCRLRMETTSPPIEIFVQKIFPKY